MGTKLHKSTANILFVDKKIMLWVHKSTANILFVDKETMLWVHKSTANILFVDKETMLCVLNPIRVLQTSCSLIRRLCCW